MDARDAGMVHTIVHGPWGTTKYKRKCDLPAFDVATELTRIGPCTLYWSQAEKLQLGVLRVLQTEIQNRYRVPVTMERLLRECERRADVNANVNAMPATQRRSWSGTVEAISRCVAAFQKATDATEHSQCQDIAAKLCHHATVLMQKTPMYIGNTDLLTLVYEFIENRTYNLAFCELLHQCLYHPLGIGVGQGEQNDECLRIIHICLEDIQDNARRLQDEMRVY